MIARKKIKPGQKKATMHLNLKKYTAHVNAKNHSEQQYCSKSLLVEIGGGQTHFIRVTHCFIGILVKIRGSSPFRPFRGMIPGFLIRISNPSNFFQNSLYCAYTCQKIGHGVGLNYSSYIEFHYKTVCSSLFFVDSYYKMSKRQYTK